MSLQSRVGAALSRTVDPAVSAFAAHLVEGNANALAVLFYGSNLRTGQREGVLDFYILTEGAPESGLWPTVSYREWDFEGETLRAKIATMTLAKFSEAASGSLVDTTIWARFVQPSALAWCKQANDPDKNIGKHVAAAIEDATATAASLAIALGPEQGSEEDYWRALFQATYKAEFRVEKPGREDSILSLNKEHFDGLLPDALEFAEIPFTREGELITPTLASDRKREILKRWGKARRWGKALNIARLIRATRTFEGAGRYAAWKVERHTGVKVEVTPWREKHPILSAPAVWWKVWRAKRRS